MPKLVVVRLKVSLQRLRSIVSYARQGAMPGRLAHSDGVVARGKLRPIQGGTVRHTVPLAEHLLSCVPHDAWELLVPPLRRQERMSSMSETIRLFLSVGRLGTRALRLRQEMRQTPNSAKSPAGEFARATREIVTPEKGFRRR